jgi:uncharacterized SAM-binding protein YcdF (DUF218 family)
MLTVETLLDEFKDLYRHVGEQSPPLDTQAVIVLTCDGPKQHESENFYRIERGLTALKALPEGVPMYFSGVTEEDAYSTELMRKLGVPSEVALFQDCGPRGVANTKTQFEAILEDPRTRDLKSIVLVTSSYHVPRVARSASKLLPESMRFVVLADMDDFLLVPFHPLLKVAGEIERILKYVAKGDIAEFPR